ncbi:TPA: thioredoxin-disulfide reductase [Candidatus Dependentiae bacterium]|nr:MAG: Thioredoxin reductase [candidate division TM6 bacterium GW2011_GWF2_36_131]KKQ02634.1 MAG: Thioredoxin reductase [candidate division TM6 bacterium GW2011_GWE2_36_25]KKQ19232.1 MAG: Thioredoxin reductase [candidate division TM6 bacterium GW2011_GWA2_36_9]HBR70266.1 thioredoxin-disulfide reductase [Candidatus Dependentiae bacterium]HCU00962.1 thioredoxin-disulfide reductase [Candidatus Dependentiae bacterium]
MKRFLLCFIPFVLNLNSDFNSQTYQLIIIGTGPAGLTAAIYAGRAKLKPLVVEGKPSLLTMVTNIENWPCHERISGAELIEDMTRHAKKTGAIFISEQITEINLKQRPFILKTASGTTLSTEALIIATGMCPKQLGCPGEKEYFGKGIANCAHCDAPLFEDTTVAIVGDGMMALQNAIILKKYAKKILLFSNKKNLSGPNELIQQVENSPSIEIIPQCTIKKIMGDDEKVTNIEVYSESSGKIDQFDVDGVFISLGYEPCTQLVKNVLPTDAEGRIKTDALGHTKIPGVFIAGNAGTIPHGQAIICASSGCIAAIEAERFLGRKPRKAALFSCQKS